jgi:DNA helicase HerA-like ATPase
MVSASPVADVALQAQLEESVNLHTRVSTLSKATGSISETGKSTTFKEGVPVQESRQRSFEVTNRKVQLLLETLDRQIKRLEMGRAEGMWSATVCFFAPEAIVAARAGALAHGCFGGSESRPEPIRVALQNSGGTLAPSDLDTDLTSSELAILSQLPQQEYFGYRVYDYSRFDVDADVPSGEGLAIGEIKDGMQSTGNSFLIKLNDLSKHALVVGITGSGKTTTIFRLLHQLVTNSGNSIPFLIIEPAKTEYRRLIDHPAFATLRIYTLGDERIAPFRLNPFEFDITDEKERTHVQTHIDHLKSVFNAAFVLYAPMPYVLDIALHEVYEDKGWNLATGLNQRLTGLSKGSQIPERQYPGFPTLSDLQRKVAQVVARLGYEERIKMDVTAGLQARIDSLRLGGKGLMLDVAHGIDIRDLLAQPTVLELDRIGNDEEKAFTIGLLISRISAFRRLQGNSTLRHVTVIEEAHRLLKNVSTEVGTEEASNKAVAVEGFCNMLSEIRAYGEGIIIAEQIPSKLAPDAIKNTNLKLLHRMLAQDDRDIVGTSINLSEDQSRRAVTLNPQHGEVIAFAERCDRPYLLQVPLLAGVSSTTPKDEAVQKHMAPFVIGPLYEQAPDFDRFVGETDRIKRLHLSLDARDIAQSDPVNNAMIKYVQSLVVDPDYAADLGTLLQAIRRERSGLSPAEENKLSVAVAVCAAYYFAANAGDLYGGSYQVIEKMRRDLAELLNQAIRGFVPNMTSAQLQSFIGKIKPLAVNVANDWLTWTKSSYGPLIGCMPCQAKCIYRITSSELMRVTALVSGVGEAMAAKGRSKNAYWREIAAVFDHWAGTITRNAEAQRGLKLCLAAHYAHLNHADNTGFQLWFVKNVIQA